MIGCKDRDTEGSKKERDLRKHRLNQSTGHRDHGRTQRGRSGLVLFYILFLPASWLNSVAEDEGEEEEDATRENKSRVRKKEKDADCAAVGGGPSHWDSTLPVSFIRQFDLSARGLDYIQDARKSDQRLYAVYAAAIAAPFSCYIIAVIVLRKAHTLSSFNVSSSWNIQQLVPRARDNALPARVWVGKKTNKQTTKFHTSILLSEPECSTAPPRDRERGKETVCVRGYATTDHC